MKKIVVLIMVLAALEAVAFAQPGAETLYTEGQAAYDRADYATAVARWQASYDLSKEVGLLFNLAQAKRQSGDCTGAVATYHRFITDDPDPTSEQHKLAKDLARELEGTCPEKPVVLLPSTVNSTAHLNTRAQSGRTWKIAGLVTGGIGVATIAIGLGLGRHGSSIGDEITAACATSCDWAALKDKEARGKRAVTIGRALDAAGVAVIAGGAVFYYLGMRQETLTVAHAPGGGVISWSGSW